MKHTIITTLVALAATAGASPNYTLHEWGTFTTLSTSAGALLPGVEREEEGLPEFVQSHEGMEHSFWMRSIKGWRRLLAGVTVRLETPALYFYTKEPFDVHVEVGFKGGSISQWYPSRSGGETPPPIKRDARGWALGKENTLDFGRGYTGSIQWDAHVEPAGEDAAGRVFKPGETPGWIYPRHPDSALVTTKDGQTEKYLFYRGLGQITLPVVFSSTGTGKVSMKNSGNSATPGLLVYERNDRGEARWEAVGSLPPNGSTAIDLSGKAPVRDWQAGVYASGVAMLTKAGLYRKEADAMMQTWWPSYFERTGLRVFWVVPRESTDGILPLKVTPAAYDTVRVLVGRSEILTPEFESQLAADFKTAEKDGRNKWENDRYFPAFIERVNQLTGRAGQEGKKE